MLIIKSSGFWWNGVWSVIEFYNFMKLYLFPASLHELFYAFEISFWKKTIVQQKRDITRVTFFTICLLGIWCERCEYYLFLCQLTAKKGTVKPAGRFCVSHLQNRTTKPSALALSGKCKLEINLNSIFKLNSLSY